MLGALYLRRRRKLVLAPPGTHASPVPLQASLQRELEQVDYALSKDVLDHVSTWAPEELAAFRRRLLGDLQKALGAHRELRPFYRNFPHEVMELSEAQLYVNARIHYWTLLRPEGDPDPRPPLSNVPRPKLIERGTEAERDGIFTQLVRSKTAFSPQDREDVDAFVLHYRDAIAKFLPDAVPSKENLAHVGARLLEDTRVGQPFVERFVRTATDVLRLAVALAKGDVSLAEACKFPSFRRPLRRLLLGLLERAPDRVEDMRRWEGRWIRLGERLHPGELASRFPESARAFATLRAGTKGVGFGSEVEQALAARDLPRALERLATRPGELARRLDHLMRTSAAPSAVVERFAERAERVSTPVLLQVLTHFRRRSEPTSLRSFFPKGQLAKVYAIPNALDAEWPIDDAAKAALVATVEGTLRARFAALPPLGRCYVAPELEKCLVPFAMRSASKALRTLVRGSRLPLPAHATSSVLRFFIWWKNGRDRTDIDLSAILFKDDFVFHDAVTYYNLTTFGGVHSGDIVDAPFGAAEFIDIDRALCLQSGARYVVMSVNSYSGQPYHDLPECFAGWMARESAGSGEVFEPKTVVDRVDLTGNTRVCLPAIFDLEAGEMVWADVALERNPRFVNNVHANLHGAALMLRAVVELKKTTLRELFLLHVEARGTLVPTRAEADTIFALDEGVTPFDLPKIAAEYM